jgi:hypothetical protein
VPLGALVLERVSDGLAWAVIGLFAFANLRIGAQLPFVPPARFALAASCVLALAAVVMAMRRQPIGAGDPGNPGNPGNIILHEARR